MLSSYCIYNCSSKLRQYHSFLLHSDLFVLYLVPASRGWVLGTARPQPTARVEVPPLSLSLSLRRQAVHRPGFRRSDQRASATLLPAERRPAQAAVPGHRGRRPGLLPQPRLGSVRGSRNPSIGVNIKEFMDGEIRNGSPI